MDTLKNKNHLVSRGKTLRLATRTRYECSTSRPGGWFSVSNGVGTSDTNGHSSEMHGFIEVCRCRSA